MNMHKGFIGVGIIIAIVATLVIVGGAVYFGIKIPTSSKNTVENNYQTQESKNGVLNTSVEDAVTNNTTNQQIQNNNQLKKEEVSKQVETSATTQLKKFVREKYSFYAPEEWIESSVILSSGNSNGCELYSINYGGDGHRMGGSISIHTKSCFISLKLSSALIKEKIEKNGYYIVAEYDESTTSSEIIKTKEAYKKVLETFTLNN